MLQNYQIEWVFGDKMLDTNIYLAQNSNKIIINIHGLYGHKNGSDQKFLWFAEHFSNNNLAHTILYSSSRKNIANNPELSDYENKFLKFFWKNFDDEVSDAKRIIEFCLENSEKIFHQKPENLEFFVNGNSLGGTIAFFLAKDFAQIRGISSVGGALRREKWNTPIINTYPDASEIIENLSCFCGKFLLHEAGEDVIFDKEHYNDFYKNISHAQEKSRIYYDWVVHNFGKIFGEKSKKPYQEVIKNFEKYFLKNTEK